MNIADCSDLVNASLSALKEGFEVSRDKGTCHIRTPFQRRDGDLFEIFAEGNEQSGIRVSDNGATLDFLDLSGIPTDRSRAFKRLLSEVEKAHDVRLQQGEIVSHANSIDLVGETILRVLAAMNDLSQFELTRRQREPQSFEDLVAGELVGRGVSYAHSAILGGEVRPRQFTFYANSERNIVIEPLQARSQSRAVERANHLIVDVMDVWKRNANLAAIAVVDDVRDVWRANAIPDLEGFGINVVAWSKRHDQLPMMLDNPRRGPSQMFYRQ